MASDWQGFNFEDRDHLRTSQFPILNRIAVLPVTGTR
jgi:hypothetical protein